MGRRDDYVDDDFLMFTTDSDDAGFDFSDQLDRQDRREERRSRRRDRSGRKKRGRSRKEPAMAPPPPLDDDDDFVDEEEPRSRARSGSGVLVRVVPLVVVVCAVIGAVLYLGVMLDRQGQEPSAAAPSAAEEPSEVVSEDTESSEAPVPSATTSERVGVAAADGNLDGPPEGGDQSSGTDVLFAYDYAYYHLRDDVEANKVFRGEKVSGIKESVAPGTKYEIRVTPKVIGESYDVELFLVGPDGNGRTYRQTAEVELDGGKYYVKSVSLKK